VNTWKVILATVVIFGAGLVTGRLLAPRAAVPTSSPQIDSSRGSTGNSPTARNVKLPTPLPGPLRKDFIDRLDKELNLTAEQRARIEKIIRDGQDKTKELWEHVEPEMHQALVTTKDRIRAELTPEQQAQFGRLLKPKTRPQNSDPKGSDKQGAAGADCDDTTLCCAMESSASCTSSNAPVPTRL
jgi:Spy/CpxP family protein refolding chaperone